MKKKTRTAEIIEDGLRDNFQGKEISPEKKEIEDVSQALVVATESTSKDLSEQINQTEIKIQLLDQFIKRHLKEGVDYGQIAFHARNCPHKGQPAFATKLGPSCQEPFCKMSKPFLQKPGSEKFVILFNHRAKFLWIQQDFATGIFAVKCVLINNKTEKVIGEGYGSARVSEKEKWTENEAMKIACKRAQIDASLRAYGLSEHFTQDLDDMASRKDPVTTVNSPKTPYSAPTRPYSQNRQNNAPSGNFTPRNPNAPLSPAQNSKIFLLLSKLGKDKTWLENWIFQMSGVEGVENMPMGLASKVIDAMQKKYDQLNADGLEVINYPEEDIKDNVKQETEVINTPEKVELPEDEWNGF